MLLGLCVRGARAEVTSPQVEERFRIDLLTVGPGDALPTRGGHAALAACELLTDGRELCTVYNYGEAPFEDAGLEYRFLFGHVRSFLSVVGDVYDATELYGLMQHTAQPSTTNHLSSLHNDEPNAPAHPHPLALP